MKFLTTKNAKHYEYLVSSEKSIGARIATDMMIPFNFLAQFIPFLLFLSHTFSHLNTGFFIDVGTILFIILNAE